MTRAQADALTREFRDLLEPYVSDEPTQGSFRPYDPPSDPVVHIRRLIENGVIRNRVDLEVEMRADEHRLTHAQAEELRALLVVA